MPSVASVGCRSHSRRRLSGAIVRTLPISLHAVPPLSTVPSAGPPIHETDAHHLGEDLYHYGYLPYCYGKVTVNNVLFYGEIMVKTVTEVKPNVFYGEIMVKLR